VIGVIDSMARRTQALRAWLAGWLRVGAYGTHGDPYVVSRGRSMNLQVLLVDDEPVDLKNLERDLPAVFADAGLEATIHSAASFEEAFALVDDRSRRFDLILTDTYRGKPQQYDVAVLDLVNRYRGERFSPIVVFSASKRPEELALGEFVLWADKSIHNGIEDAIRAMLTTGVPQAARDLHDDLDRLAGSYLWGFLDSQWTRLKDAGHMEPDTVSRIVRRRAALQLAELTQTKDGPEPLEEVHGIEFYVYPPLNPRQFSLGEIIRHKEQPGDVRVVLTPHCYMAVQPGQKQPRAQFIMTVSALPIKEVLGAEKLTNTRELEPKQKAKRLRQFVTPPSGSDVGKPAGRYWYLPAYVEIPHLYCDFMQVNSVAYDALRAQYESLAVLAPPYAESLQACYGAFNATVGIPNVKPSSIEGMLE